MTIDKQIIIDGEQCQYLSNTGLCRLIYKLTEKSYDCSMCKDNPNCDHKQLKAKEQECEELKKGYLELTEIVSPYMDDFTGYNEELGGFDIVLCVKQLLEQLDQLKAENIKFTLDSKKLVAQYSAKLDKYKQTLTEIKEIIHFNKTNRLSGGAYISIEQILQKINEVENE